MPNSSTVEKAKRKSYKPDLTQQNTIFEFHGMAKRIKQKNTAGIASFRHAPTHLVFITAIDIYCII